jgi:hypothetical protein
MRTHVVKAADFFLRSALDPVATIPYQLDPSKLGIVVASVAARVREFTTSDQIRLEGSGSAQLTERTINVFFPREQLLLRIGPDRIEFSGAATGKEARILALIVFEQIVDALNPYFPVSKAATTTWNLHLVGKSLVPAISPEGVPPIGPLLSSGAVFNFATPKWDPSVQFVSLVLEPSALDERASFVGIRTVWADDKSELVGRHERHCEQVLSSLEVELGG